MVRRIPRIQDTGYLDSIGISIRVSVQSTACIMYQDVYTYAQ